MSTSTNCVLYARYTFTLSGNGPISYTALSHAKNNWIFALHLHLNLIPILKHLLLGLNPSKKPPCICWNRDPISPNLASNISLP